MAVVSVIARARQVAPCSSQRIRVSSGGSGTGIHLDCASPGRGGPDSIRVVATRQTEGDWVRLANEQLSRAGYNHGGARQAIVDLLGQQPCALSAPEIEDALRSSDREVARASVYRVLDELDRLGLVGRVGVGRGLTRYEPVQGEADHHDHLVCDSCGEV